MAQEVLFLNPGVGGLPVARIPTQGLLYPRLLYRIFYLISFAGGQAGSTGPPTDEITLKTQYRKSYIAGFLRVFR